LQRIQKGIATMTTIELRSSIVADLDQMSVEMLENVSRYVRSLRRRSRQHTTTISRSQQNNSHAIQLELSPRVKGFMRGNPWYATDEEVDALRNDYLMKKYQ
jgi:hypothetical protein